MSDRTYYPGSPGAMARRLPKQHVHRWVWAESIFDGSRRPVVWYCSECGARRAPSEPPPDGQRVLTVIESAISNIAHGRVGAAQAGLRAALKVMTGDERVRPLAAQPAPTAGLDVEDALARNGWHVVDETSGLPVDEPTLRAALRSSEAGEGETCHACGRLYADEAEVRCGWCGVESKATGATEEPPEMKVEMNR